MAEDASYRRQLCSFPLKFQLAVPTVLLVFSVIFEIIAIASPYWYHRVVFRNGDYETESNIGLWRACFVSSAQCVDLQTSGEHDSLVAGGRLKSVRALQVTGLATLVLAATLVTISLRASTSGRLAVLVTAITSLASGILIATGDLILFSDLTHYDFVDVSFGLSAAACGMSLINFIAFIVVYRQMGQNQLTARDRLAIYRQKESYLTCNSKERFVDTCSSEDLRAVTGYRNPLLNLAVSSGSECSTMEDEVSESEYSESSL